MKKLLYPVLIAAALALAPAVAFAQSTRTQQDPTRLDACGPLSSTAAVNNTVTLTIPAPPSGYIYICGIDLNVSNNATGAVVSTNLIFTSTNFGGWQYKFSAVNAANTNGLDKSFVWASPLKSQVPSTAVTVVSPAANAQAAYTITAYFYYAP